MDGWHLQKLYVFKSIVVVLDVELQVEAKEIKLFLKEKIRIKVTYHQWLKMCSTIAITIMNPGIQNKQFLANAKLKFFTVIFPSCSLSICLIVKMSCLMKYTQFNFTFLKLIYHAILRVVNYFRLKLKKMTLSTCRIAPLARFPKMQYCFHFFKLTSL